MDMLPPIGLAALAHRLRCWPQLLVASGSALAIWGLHLLVRYATYQLPHGVYVLRDLPLRAILFPQQVFPTQATADLVAHGFMGRLLFNPTLAGLLTLASCGVMLSAVLWYGRQTLLALLQAADHAPPCVRTHGTNDSGDEVR